MRLRLFQPDDLEATAALWCASWQHAFPDLTHPWPPAEWCRQLAEVILPAFTVVIAEDDGAITGFLALDERRGYLDQLFVAPAAQGCGTGSVLLGEAKRRSAQGLTLHTLLENAPARAFYERHGFERGATSRNAVNGRPNVVYHWRP